MITGGRGVRRREGSAGSARLGAFQKEAGTAERTVLRSRAHNSRQKALTSRLWRPVRFDQPFSRGKVPALEKARKRRVDRQVTHRAPDQ